MKRLRYSLFRGQLPDAVALRARGACSVLPRLATNLGDIVLSPIAGLCRTEHFGGAFRVQGDRRQHQRLGRVAPPGNFRCLSGKRVADLGDQVEAVLSDRLEVRGIVRVALCDGVGGDILDLGPLVLLVLVAARLLPRRHALGTRRADCLLLPGEIGALAFGYFRQGIVEQRVEQAGLHHSAAARIDLAVHGIMQAGAIGRCVGRHIGLGSGDLVHHLAAGNFGVERLLLLFALLKALGDGRKLAAQALHGAADWRSLRILHRVAGIDPALSKLERNSRHLIVSCPTGSEQSGSLRWRSRHG
ncbi:hypothetical protein MESS4_730010 [Mesorhizobium sp. STM 4661]|nr:hypothetical protein MESS4_730010 [Mesorhizobium sp. STM 4661]